jgi:hypothetical protein
MATIARERADWPEREQRWARLRASIVKKRDERLVH